jgi:hypothetical protein
MRQGIFKAANARCTCPSFTFFLRQANLQTELVSIAIAKSLLPATRLLADSLQ